MPTLISSSIASKQHTTTTATGSSYGSTSFLSEMTLGSTCSRALSNFVVQNFPGSHFTTARAFFLHSKITLFYYFYLCHQHPQPNIKIQERVDKDRRHWRVGESKNVVGYYFVFFPMFLTTYFLNCLFMISVVR